MRMPPFGFALVFVSAISGATLALRFKKRLTFELDNLYIPFTLVMMPVLPFIVVTFVLPIWTRAIFDTGSATLSVGSAYGFGWCIGSILFGYGVTAGEDVGPLRDHYGHQCSGGFTSTIRREFSHRTG